MKLLRTIWNWVLFLLTFKGPIAEEAKNDNIIDYSEDRDENSK